MRLLLPSRWSASRRGGAAAIATAALLAAGFAVAYGQAPLYAGNQSTYLLKPFAEAGRGFLVHDWLAGTADRMPATSLLVRLTVEYADEALLHLYQALLVGAYGLALAGLAAFAMRSPTRGRLWVCIAVLFAVHFGGGWKLLTGGVAGQSATLQVFEPALFGTLLVLSLYLFARERQLAAVACLAVAATAHPTYLLPGALVALTYGAVTLRRDRRPGLAAGVLGLYALSVAPIALYTLATFRPSSVALHARASEILADHRIPYHTDPAVWFHPEDVARVALIAAAALVVRRTRLAPVLGGLLAAGVALTLARVALDSRDLGLLFPWRVSVMLVPAATALLVGAAVERASRAGPALLRRRDRLLAGVGVAAVAILSAVQVPPLADAVDGPASDAEPLSGYVAATKRPDDVYLLPVGEGLAPIDEWRSFRLRTGAPVYVDLKSHPLRDREVIEWWRRVQTARALYRHGFPACAGLQAVRRDARVSAVVVSSAARPPRGCPGLRLVHRDPRWSLYRLSP